jgi:hypothetical protein
MVRKGKSNKTKVEDLSTQELYAAWGTTREAHLERMMKRIEEYNQKADEILARSGVDEVKVEKAVAVKAAAAARKAVEKGRVMGWRIRKSPQMTGSGQVVSTYGTAEKLIMSDLVGGTGSKIATVPKVGKGKKRGIAVVNLAEVKAFKERKGLKGGKRPKGPKV